MQELNLLDDVVLKITIALAEINKTELKRHQGHIWGNIKIVKRKEASAQGSDLTVYQELDDGTKNYIGSGKSYTFKGVSPGSAPRYISTPIDDFIINHDINFSLLEKNMIDVSAKNEQFLNYTISARRDKKGVRAYRGKTHIGNTFIYFFRKKVEDMQSAKMNDLRDLDFLFYKTTAETKQENNSDDLPF